jgi:hypothetical protein
MDATPTTESVPPSALVRATVRHMVKVLNPLVAKLAGTRFMSMAALVTHTGRPLWAPVFETRGRPRVGNLLSRPTDLRDGIRLVQEPPGGRRRPPAVEGQGLRGIGA